jgi:hypothetical protein
MRYPLFALVVLALPAAGLAEAGSVERWSDAQFIRASECAAYVAIAQPGEAAEFDALKKELKKRANRHEGFVVDRAGEAAKGVGRAVRRAETETDKAGLRDRMERACAGFISTRGA